ncbi:predicted protein [Sclerotinia sclerotiorum 1980 UF-70]|uniref:Uncharacterized protein n=1 Tax=Sclerotinia sclerotiorum (strain ATCC 18683 / 1980 / Ss-1) TaxID=665079 RepID=A7EU50_SCLS1|nr:predicted protein [Sclerotinia sclerotiorum 1980 UF-70]EDN92992.1 predicted protein [Sclerotinia sclerotiorum 1980 UF-70]
MAIDWFGATRQKLRPSHDPCESRWVMTNTTAYYRPASSSQSRNLIYRYPYHQGESICTVPSCRIIVSRRGPTFKALVEA